MFKTIKINNFRCFDDFEIDNLTRINLISGKNSVGKTALLEAIFLLIGAENISLVLKVSGFRGLTNFAGDIDNIVDLIWTPLFHNFNSSRKATISGEIKNKRGRYSVEFRIRSADAQRIPIEESGSTASIFSKKLSLNYKNLKNEVSDFEMAWIDGQLGIKPVPASPPFPGFFYSTRSGTKEEDSTLFGNLVKTKRSFDLVKILSSVDERLVNLTTIQSGGNTMIYGDIGLEQLLPISLMGDGIGRLNSILLRIANATNGVVLIDEIENGFHYSILKDVWEAIGEAARTFNTQIFITTHSYEAIKNAHEVFRESLDFSYHRLDRIEANVEAITYNSSELGSALSSEFEIR